MARKTIPLTQGPKRGRNLLFPGLPRAQRMNLAEFLRTPKHREHEAYTALCESNRVRNLCKKFRKTFCSFDEITAEDLFLIMQKLGGKVVFEIAEMVESTFDSSERVDQFESHCKKHLKSQPAVA